MTKLAWLAPLLYATALAAAPGPVPVPAPPPPPSGLPHDACPATGDVLLEVDHRPDVGARVASSTLVVHDDGAWTLAASDADGHTTRAAHGCLDAGTLAHVRGDLDGAPWQIGRAAAMCEMFTDAYDLYLVRGKAVWSARACQLPMLDDASERALADVNARLDAATAEHAPPCCKK